MLDLGARNHQRVSQLTVRDWRETWWLSMADGLESTDREETTTSNKKISKRSLKRLQVREVITSTDGSYQNYRNP